VSPAAPAYDAKINEVAATIAAKLQAMDDISRVLFLVLEKK